MMKRIAFCGASGTGKSTLATHLSDLLGVPINPVGARSVASAMGFDSPYAVDRAGKRAEFQQRLLADKLAWEREHDAFVTDRTSLDNLVYTLLHDVAAIDIGTIENALDGVERYTHVFLCPIESFHRPGGDPARLQSPAYHWLFELVLKALIEHAQLKERIGALWTIKAKQLRPRMQFVEHIVYGGTL